MILRLEDWGPSPPPHNDASPRLETTGTDWILIWASDKWWRRFLGRIWQDDWAREHEYFILLSRSTLAQSTHPHTSSEHWSSLWSVLWHVSMFYLHLHCVPTFYISSIFLSADQKHRIIMENIQISSYHGEERLSRLEVDITKALISCKRKFVWLIWLRTCKPSARGCGALAGCRH